MAALLLASAVPATASESPGDQGGTTGAPGNSLHLSLDDAIARAQDSSPDLLALAGSTEAAEHEAAAVRRRRWGDLDAVASYQLHSDDVIVRPISRQLLSGGFANLPFDDQQWHYGVTAEVPLYLGGKLASCDRDRRAVGKDRARAAHRDALAGSVQRHLALRHGPEPRRGR